MRISDWSSDVCSSDLLKGQVFLRFLVEALLKVARRNEFTLFTEERRVVDGKEHVHRRLVDMDDLQLLGVFKVGQGVTDVESFDSNDGADITDRKSTRLKSRH